MACEKKTGACARRALSEKAMSRRHALALAGSAIASGLLSACGAEKLGACVGAGKGLQIPAAGSLSVGQAGIYPDPATNPLFIIAHDGQGFMAMKNYCTHAGVGLKIEADGTYFCEQHGSRFGFDGTLIAGPALRPLDHVAMCRRADNVLVVDKTTVLPDLNSRVT